MSNWVWRSTETSRAESKISILAIIETLFFVLLTWGIAFYYNFYYYFFVPLVLTPFLMLKTPESVESSHHLFLYEIDKNYFIRSAWIWFALIMSGLITFFIVTSLPENIYLINIGSQRYLIFLFVIGAIFLISFAIVVATLVSGGKDIVTKTVNESINEVKIISNLLKTVVIIVGIFLIFKKINLKDSMIMLSIMSVTMSLSNGIIGGFILIIRSLLIKLFVTFRSITMSPLYTISYLPTNWREQVLVNDIFYTPELLPEIRKHNRDFQLIGLLHGNGLLQDKLEKLFRYILAFFWVFAYLYRWSIKSTAWFYFPLAFVFNKRKLEDKTKGKTLIDDQTNTVKVWGYGFIFLMLLFYFANSYINENKIGEVLPLISIVNYQNLISDYPIMKSLFIPQTAWLVLSASLIYAFLYYVSNIQQHRRIHNNPEYSEAFNTILHWFIRFKYVLWIAFFAINLFFIANEHILPLIFNFLQNV